MHLHEILARLGAQGHTATLLCCRFPGAPEREEYDNITVIRRGGRNTFNWSVPGAVRQLFAENSYDVVIDDINKIPFYSHRFAPVPVLAIVHHLFGTAIFREVNPLFAGYVYFMESLIPRFYRSVPVMVVSESTRDDLVGRGMDPALIRVVHNGIDHDLYRPGAPEQKEAHPLIVYVGRLKRYKSIDHLFAAAARIRATFPNLAIQILGAGDDQPRLEKAAASLGVAGCVHFAGFISFERKIEILQRAWVVVCPSLKEGWGLTNIEANACGTPVVCADVPGLRDSARDGRTGLLYPYGDIGVLAERLKRMLNDADLRRSLRAGGLEWAARFNWDRAARATEAILETVARGNPRIGTMTEPDIITGADGAT
ncbi:MAG TPA: glycosyltransferase family 4 protein [Acidobacteriota bacterium]|nr:glycosyltransferase family 4 protein [Acidobacteriota bacterium]